MARRTLRQIIDDDDADMPQWAGAMFMFCLYTLIAVGAWCAAIGYAFRTHWFLGALTIALPAIGIHYTITKERR